VLATNRHMWLSWERGSFSVAVSGNVFASPNGSAVLRAIRHAAAATPAGVLVIIKNYTGDRLAFGIAIERARAEGVCVDAVLVADDAVVQGGIGGRRGLAGTLLVQKVAGALADAGEALTVSFAVRKRCRGVRCDPQERRFPVATFPGNPRPSQKPPPNLTRVCGIMGVLSLGWVSMESLAHNFCQLG